VVDVADCYIVTFVDAAGTFHAVPFRKKAKGNQKATAFLKSVKDLGFSAEKYAPYTGLA
jgi:hypothetical protein